MLMDNIKKNNKKVSKQNEGQSKEWWSNLI
jgi:hypothetical protein